MLRVNSEWGQNLVANKFNMIPFLSKNLKRDTPVLNKSSIHSDYAGEIFFHPNNTVFYRGHGICSIYLELRACSSGSGEPGSRQL